MKKIIKKAFKVVLPLALGGFILLWVYKDFDFSRVGEVLEHGMNYWWMLLTLVFGVFSHVLRGWRWKQTLAPLGAYPKTSDCVNAIFVSYAANLVVPRIGEISRCGILSKYDNVSFSKSLGTVVTERLIDTLCVALITGLTLVLQMKFLRRNRYGSGFCNPFVYHGEFLHYTIVCGGCDNPPLLSVAYTLFL